MGRVEGWVERSQGRVTGMCGEDGAGEDVVESFCGDYCMEIMKMGYIPCLNPMKILSSHGYP